MKLPKAIEGIHREGRADAVTDVADSGVQPQLFGGLISRLPGPLGDIGGAACKAGCNMIPNPIAKMACIAACS